MKVKLSAIRTDGGTQPRAHISDDLVLEYCDVIESLPPVTLFYDGKAYWLADGFHRVEAADRCGLNEIEADVQQGTQRDAILYACGANAAHGQRRTNEDKRRAVTRLLGDAEWGKWSDREIARRCAVDHVFVGKLRAGLSGDNHQMPIERTVRRGEQVYQQHTENIGRKPERERTASRVAAQMPPVSEKGGGRDETEEMPQEDAIPAAAEDAIEAIMDTIKQQIDGLDSVSAVRATVKAVLAKLTEWSRDLEA